MFGKTREKLEEKYVKPVQNGIALIAVLSVVAFLMALVALAKVI